MPRRRRPPLLAIAVSVGLGALASRPATPLGSTSASAAGNPSREGRPARAGDPGDSVLALIGTDRVVTLGSFMENWTPTAPQLDSLTPQAARGFLELLIDKEVLAEAALKESWVWTAEESAGYLALRDRLMVAAILDSALRGARETLRAAGDTTEDVELIGVAARDSAVARMGVAFDEPLVARLAAAWSAIPRPVSDSSATAQLHALSAMPAVDTADSLRVIAHSSEGDYRVGNLLGAWRRLSPAYRPRVASAEALRDLVRNGLFERSLRSAAERRRLDERAEVSAALSRARERIAVTHFVARRVYGALVPDSLEIARFHREHRDEWALPFRVRALRLASRDRGEADRTVLRLRDPAEAESLTALARRHGLDYVAEVTAASDSALFAAAMRAGAGAVLGPEERDGEWWVTRVNELLPGRTLGLEEVRERVVGRWLEQASERRLGELCGRLRKRTRVKVNDRALERVLPVILARSRAAAR